MMGAAERIPELISESEAARILRVSPITLARYRKARKIGHITIGNRPYYTEAIITQYLEKQECPASESPTNTHSSSEPGPNTGISNGASAEKRNAALRALQALTTPE
jgi:hypothetical protein